MMQSIIFSYNRKYLLLKAISELKCISSVAVFDDSSDFTIESVDFFKNKEHRGREFFYLTWQEAYSYAKSCKADYFIFAPDDFINYDLKKINKCIEALDSNVNTWALHLHVDYREELWRKFTPVKFEFNGLRFTEVGFVDCAYIVPRRTMEALGYHSPVVHSDWINNFGSSGVGRYQSNYFAEKKIRIFKPETSICFHAGNNCSVMHPEERKKVPLVSL